MKDNSYKLTGATPWNATMLPRGYYYGQRESPRDTRYQAQAAYVRDRAAPLCNTSFVAKFRRGELWIHPFDPVSATCGSHEWIRKVLCSPRNLVVPELHNAYGVGGLAVICQDEFGHPKITAAHDSSDDKPLFARLTSALILYVASAAGPLA